MAAITGERAYELKASMVCLQCKKLCDPYLSALVHNGRYRNLSSFPLNYKKDGYRQRNVRQFLHILASPGYAPGTIAVNVTWMERGLNACQTHGSMYPSIFSR